ncbi:hypothetical protein T06_15994 [Trichinella sp. T6]|nr:hypothetical protein T06_15994 [Trichinella sp. T6]
MGGRGIGVPGEEGENTFLLEWRELQRIYNSV